MKGILLLVFLFFCITVLGSTNARVAIIYSTGGLGDESYNDLAHKGLNEAKKNLDVDFEYYEPKDPSREAENQLTQYSEMGKYDLIIVVGFSLKDSLEKVAKNYPKQKYAIIDEIVYDTENITSITFNVEEESFLSGVAAGLITKTGKVGFIGGAPSPYIMRYGSGFEQGAKYVKPDIKVLISYIEGSNAFNDPERAESITDKLIKKNVDIFYHASGASKKGIVSSAKKQGKYIIDIDLYQNFKDDRTIVASTVKNIDIVLYDILKKLTENTLESKVYLYGIKEKGVGIITGSEDKIGTENIKKINEIIDLIKVDKIKIYKSE